MPKTGGLEKYQYMVKTYYKRICDQILKDKLEAKGAVLIKGAKWCGKTTTGEKHAKSILYIEDPARKKQYLDMADVNPSQLLQGEVPRLIDEWQLAPKLWDAVRFEVDKRDEFGQFILTGSAVPPDISEISHTGIGRITSLLMRPMSLFESGDSNGKVKISNRIIETWLYNLFSTEEEIDSHLYDKGSIEKNQFIDGKTLKMDKILEKFAQHFRDIYGNKDLNFKEEEGRRFFMLYIRPIINGTGNYYIEAETRDRSRTDMIIDYYGTQYIIEMKIWRGDSYNERGENQLFEYLDFYHTDKGYLLSFCFNKKTKPEAKTINLGGKEIVEVVV